MEAVCTPRQEKGPAKFGREHGIRAPKGQGQLTAEEVRAEAAHYQDNTDK